MQPELYLHTKKSWRKHREKALKPAPKPIYEPRSSLLSSILVILPLISGLILIFIASTQLMGCDIARASNIMPYTPVQYCNAIYIIEGGAHTKHPYGIMTHYKHTTPRQACINTVLHKYRDWINAGRLGTFEHYLSVRYAPVGASNDPQGLNINWERNLLITLQREN